MKFANGIGSGSDSLAENVDLDRKFAKGTVSRSTPVNSVDLLDFNALVAVTTNPNWLY